MVSACDVCQRWIGADHRALYAGWGQRRSAASRHLRDGFLGVAAVTLVYTCNEGSAQSQLELSTPSQNVARPVLQELAQALTYPAPGGGLLRVPVGGGAPAPLIGLESGQLVAWDAAAGQWVAQRIIGVQQSQLGYAPVTGGPPSNLLTLLPAGHPPGSYLFSFTTVVRTVGVGAGSLTATFNFASPNFGAQSVALGLSLNALGTSSATGIARVFASSGAAPLTLQFSVVGVTVSGLVDLYGAAMAVGL
jgi:hypothetical protein